MSKKVSKRRKVAGAVAITLAVAMVVTGTLAWQAISQRAVNNQKWTADETGGRLHDDFAENQDILAGANKDVYVENYSGLSGIPGDTGRPIYVRVRLSEYMEVGPGAGKFAYTGAVDPEDYQDLDKTGTGGARTDDPANMATPLVAGSDILNLDTWQLHIPMESVSEDNTDMDYYWDWSMGGSKVYMPTFNKDNESLLTDRTQYAHTEFAEGATLDGTAIYAEPEDPAMPNKAEEHTAELTETAEVIMMDDWIAGGSKPEDAAGNGYWVGDVDGWFYWSRALEPGKATGLLLDKITMVSEPEGESYYAIHVVSQMASSGDWGEKGSRTGFYADGLTDNALNLLNRAAGREPVVTSIGIEGAKNVFVKAGEAISFNANVNVKNGTGNSGETIVNWSINPTHPHFTTVNQTTAQTSRLTTLAEDVGRTFTITATSAELKDGSKSAHVTVVVYPAEGVGVEGPKADGNYYINYGDNTYREIKVDGSVSTAWKSAGNDQVIGNGDDLAPVTVRGDGIKLLGPYEEGQYRIKGDNGMLGTDGSEGDKWVWPEHGDAENDNLINYNPDKEIHQVVLDQVSETGDGKNIARPGGTIKYTASVTKTSKEEGVRPAADGAVKWTILGSHAEYGTALSTTDYTEEEITLTIGATEPSGTNVIILQATSREGDAVATVNVSVKAIISNTSLGGTFTDQKGLEWMVVGVVNGHKLIITRYLQMVGTPYNYTNSWTSYESSNIKSALQGFYVNSVGTDVRTAAVPYSPTTLPDIRHAYTDSDFNQNEKSYAGASEPAVGESAKDNGGDAIFILSISELNIYVGVKERIAYVQGGTAPKSWWLRSPGNAVSKSGCSVDINGVPVPDNADSIEGIAVRPALWVKGS